MLKKNPHLKNFSAELTYSAPWKKLQLSARNLSEICSFLSRLLFWPMTPMRKKRWNHTNSQWHAS